MVEPRNPSATPALVQAKQVELSAATRHVATMKNAAQFSMVFVTAPNIKAARALAKVALESRLIACANLIPKLESHYWWRGKLESSPEVLLILKTRSSHLKRLERLILAHHPYDTPEFIALPLKSGTNRYLEWLGAECLPK